MREVNEIHGTAPFYCVASFARANEPEIKTMRKKLIVYCIEWSSASIMQGGLHFSSIGLALV